jgi:uncharacterized Ntn-hydrolase superfamily protein
MIDARGRVAAHTGARCIQFAGQITDSEQQFSVQANLMGSERVWTAMAEAFRHADGDLADRLVAALAGAEEAGGDIRGRQSAAIIVVKAEATGKPWMDRKFDLRVEDHPEPVKELARLVQLQRAYLHMNAGDAAVEAKDWERALAEYAAAEKLAPHIVEIPFWQAVSLTSAGRVEEALPIFRRVFAREAAWVDLVPRLASCGILPKDETLLASIAAQAP